MRKQGRLDEAVIILRQALNLDNTVGIGANAHAYTHNVLGLALQQQGNVADAIAQFQQAIDLDPSFAEAYNNLQAAQRQSSTQNRGGKL
ncbi:tetratricopeptide repeat protein [Phormidium tenue FACHB-886]|nr:tetratricopeptide repeat protein [Phormidium tenue FACHB-886]